MEYVSNDDYIASPCCPVCQTADFTELAHVRGRPVRFMICNLCKSSWVETDAGYVLETDTVRDVKQDVQLQDFLDNY